VENLFGVKSKNHKAKAPPKSTRVTKVFSKMATNEVPNNEQHNYKIASKLEK